MSVCSHCINYCEDEACMCGCSMPHSYEEKICNIVPHIIKDTEFITFVEFGCSICDRKYAFGNIIGFKEDGVTVEKALATHTTNFKYCPYCGSIIGRSKND